jgi:hypothetical protein
MFSTTPKITKHMKHVLNFRWPVKLIDPHQAEILSNPSGAPMFTKEFADSFSDRELAKAESLIIQKFILINEE